MDLEKFREIQDAIRKEQLDGWLFCNFRHRDPLADEILGIKADASNSRMWFYAVPASGEAHCILHAVEPDVFAIEAGVLPGQYKYYCSREELFSYLSALAGKKWGCHFSKTITAISWLDAGTASLLEEAGLLLASAEGLIQRFKGLLDHAAMESHERAASHLYEIVDIVWAEVKQAFTGGRPIYEGDILRIIKEEFSRRGLETKGTPIVAAGRNSGNPHYHLAAQAGKGAQFAENDVILFDLWAKEKNGIFADISWVGVYAKSAPQDAEKAFSALIKSRESALQFIAGELNAGRRPKGACVDMAAKQILKDCGFADAMRHRTGHGIDTEVHGSGVNIDSVEFPDSRPLLDGACFSLEPGVYFPGFGMRTEINVYIKDGKPVISGKGRQFALLNCEG